MKVYYVIGTFDSGKEFSKGPFPSLAAATRWGKSWSKAYGNRPYRIFEGFKPCQE